MFRSFFRQMNEEFNEVFAENHFIIWNSCTPNEIASMNHLNCFHCIYQSSKHTRKTFLFLHLFPPHITSIYFVWLFWFKFNTKSSQRQLWMIHRELKRQHYKCNENIFFVTLKHRKIMGNKSVKLRNVIYKMGRD